MDRRMGDYAIMARNYGHWTWDLIEHHRYWTPERRRFRQIEAGLRVSMKRKINALAPDAYPMFRDLSTDALRLVLVSLMKAN